MTVRVGVNGFGRIGRNFLRAVLATGADVNVVGVNDLTSAETLAYLLRYDSTHGRLPVPVAGRGERPDRRRPADPGHGRARARAAALGQARGRRRDRVHRPLHQPGRRGGAPRRLGEAGHHLDRRRATPTPPSSSGSTTATSTPTVHVVVSNASCTTNCFVPMVKVVDDAFDIVSGLMTTVHAYTNDQNLLDLTHNDLRRARAAAANIVPTSTGAARATGLVLEAMKGRLDGTSLRVPLPDGSITDFTAVVRGTPSVAEVNERVRRGRRQAAARPRARVHRGPDRLARHRGLARIVHLRLGADHGHADRRVGASAGRSGEGVRLVRQRVGLLEPAGRPGRARRSGLGSLRTMGTRTDPAGRTSEPGGGPAPWLASRRSTTSRTRRSTGHGSWCASTSTSRSTSACAAGPTVADDFRITAALPTLQWLLERGAEVTATSHLGRPAGERDPRWEMDPVRERLEALCPGVALTDNLRFDPGEKAERPRLRAAPDRGYDAYVNEAFGAAHRSDASIVGPPHFLPQRGRAALRPRGRGARRPARPTGPALRRRRRRRQGGRQAGRPRGPGDQGRHAGRRRRHGLHLPGRAGPPRGRLAARRVAPE